MTCLKEMKFYTIVCGNIVNTTMDNLHLLARVSGFKEDAGKIFKNTFTTREEAENKLKEMKG